MTEFTDPPEPPDVSASGACYYIKDTAASGTTYGSDPTRAACAGNDAAAGATATTFP